MNLRPQSPAVLDGSCGFRLCGVFAPPLVIPPQQPSRMGIGSESAGATKGSAPYQSPAVLVNAQTDVQGVAASFRGKRQAYGFGDRGLTPLFRIGLTAIGPIV